MPKDLTHALFVTFVKVKIPAEDMSLVKLFWERYKQILCDKGTAQRFVRAGVLVMRD